MMKIEETHLSSASIRSLDGKQRPAHAAIPIPRLHQLSSHYSTKPSSVLGITPQCPAYGLPLPCHLVGDQKSHPKEISILSYKTSSSVAEGQTRRRVSGLAPQAKSIWLSSVSAAATGGISKNSVTLSFYTCQGFGLFPQAWQGPRLRGPSVAPGSREIGVTLPTLQKRNLGAVDLRAHS